MGGPRHLPFRSIRHRQRSEANTSSSSGPRCWRPRSRNHSRPSTGPSSGPGSRSSSATVRTERLRPWSGSGGRPAPRAWPPGDVVRRPGGSAPAAGRTRSRTGPAGSSRRTPGTHRSTDDTRADQLAVDGRLQHHGSARQLGGPHPDPVHLHVVEVAVATARVVHRQRVCPFLRAGSWPVAAPAPPDPSVAKPPGFGGPRTVARVGVPQDLPAGAPQRLGRLARAPGAGVLRDWPRSAYHRRQDRPPRRSRSRAPRGGRPQRPAPGCRRSAAPRRRGARERRRG